MLQPLKKNSYLKLKTNSYNTLIPIKFKIKYLKISSYALIRIQTYSLYEDNTIKRKVHRNRDNKNYKKLF